MATFEQFVILFDTLPPSRSRTTGHVYYPSNLANQDITVVLATYGAQGFEVLSQEMTDTHGMVVLKKSA